MLNIFIDIVDDNKDDAELIKMVLNKKFKNEIRIFNDPDEFLSLPANEMNLGIIDFRYQNSGKTGYDIAKEVRKKNRHCYMIMITAFAQVSELRKSWNLGVRACLDKKVETFNEELIEAVETGIEEVNWKKQVIEYIPLNKRNES
jgi:DNA-binding NtrC family response regulator